MACQSFERNGLEWCDGKLIMVSFWVTGSKLPPTVMKQSHNVKVTKNDGYLSDNNLTDDEENIAESEIKTVYLKKK